ncbi:hypothetical protein D9756_011355 [Leucocoprinus leucothites]|uniref:Uncharacterized protein n=1 Tax=Leucocoprinus leucothites TaxID=201217 RepID=A0A8H5CMJ4_9AGAR|nr:hypothetical protein D9756_011355 [Leucoagaricus leucothites]
MDNSQDDPEYSNSHLATLLADSYKDAESLRRELTATKKRAEKAERLLHGLQTIQQSAGDVSSSSGPSPDVSRMLMDYEERLARAERARDEADARRRAMHDNWLSVDRYLALIEHRAQDARVHYARVVSGDNTNISLPSISPYSHPTASSSHVFPPLPPHPNPNPHRRPRTPSMESSFPQPPAKRSRGDSDDRGRRYPDPAYPPTSAPPPPGYDDYRRREPRMVRPPGSRGPGRSRSRSSEKSISSVDEMLLQATAQESNGTNGAPNRRQLHPPNAYPSVGQQRSHPDSPPYPRPRVDHPGPPLGPASANQQAQPYLFAPIVTGAPSKKQKYAAGGGVTPAASTNNMSGGPIETPPVPAPPVAAFPPTNAEGQRICRQCGLPGRYKDGKCVEKWGPGPMGPGTVCDRCRKKMKRVERRGTLEQQLANASTLGRAGSQHVVVQHQQPPQPPPPPPPTQQQHHPLQRSDTVLSGHQGSNNNGSQMSFRTVMSSSTSPGKSAGGRAMSPPPAIASLKDDEDHVAGRSSSRSSSRNGRPASRQQIPAQSQQHLSVPAKRSPLGSTGSVSGDGGGNGGGGGGGGTARAEADGETDADAEAEVDADAEGDGDHEEYEIEDDDEQPLPRKRGEMIQRAAREADEELLEAVDAAEANSSSSHVGGRRYHDDD